MRLLHTSDWHLGQKFIYNDREAEHQLALDWLIETIHEQQVEALIIAGDIFDIGNPPNYARRMYFRFLASLQDSPCRHIICIGGNHDSPSMLDAPKELLVALNVHVVGSASDLPQEQILELYDSTGKLEAVVAAVPFLRDRDIRASQVGESGQERIERIRMGIVQHYEKMGDLAQTYRDQAVPLIVTGHLYAAGSTASERQDNIYLGDVNNIQADQFPTVFDYVALGHIHRAQTIGGQEHIRYSGSLIPLSFSEVLDEKVVYIIDFEKNKIGEIRTVPVPLFRRLKTIEGNLEEIQEKLEQFQLRHQEDPLTPWVEIMLHSEKPLPDIHNYLAEFTQGFHLELLKVRIAQANQQKPLMEQSVSLDELEPLAVFEQKCQAEGYEPEEVEQLKSTFRELLDWVQELDEEPSV